MEHIKIVLAKILFTFGYKYFELNGETPVYSYRSLRKLFYTSNGQFNKKISKKISKQNPPYKLEEVSKGILGDITQKDSDFIVSKLNQDGFYIFDKLLNEIDLQKLLDFSLEKEARLMPYPKLCFKKYNRDNPEAVKYQFLEKDLVNNEVVQNILTDKSILKISQDFLGSKPIIDLISMWWSTCFSKEASSEIAQLYHFDMERIKFIKFFIYLTDVDEQTGPHCYVKGSTKNIPLSVRKDGRIDDREIENAYNKEDLLEICGEKGTILAVDTSGFHKGKKLEKNDRLLFQIELTNSLFGVKNTYYKVENSSEKLKKAKVKFPELYQRYSV